MHYKYKLDKSSRKYPCPNCGKKTFVRFVDSVSGELQGEKFGRCDREDSCRYFLYPKSELIMPRNVAKSQLIRNESIRQTANRKQVYIPWDAYQTYLSGYDSCPFFDYLSSKGVPDELLEKVIEMYYLGTFQLGYLRGALAIPFITVDGNIAFVQVKQFDEQNKTIKTNALHSLLKDNPGNQWIEEYEKNDLKVSSFFGAHLLKRYPNNPIILVEAPKTAIYGTCYYGLPKDENGFLWLAVFNKSSLREEKFKILEGRTVLLIPDLSIDSRTFNEWQEKASKYVKNLNNTKVSFLDFLEVNAPEELRKSGGDFADYLCQFIWQEYQSGCQSVKSVKNDAEKKHFLENAPINDTSNKLESFLQPNRGYSMREIIVLASDFEIFPKLNDLQIVSYLIEKCVIKQDFERDNYYRFDSLPF